jgi:hypothetical protein
VHTRARALRDETPFDMAAVLGHALSLRAQRRHREALLELDTLQPAQREHPRVKLWRAVMLHDLGRSTESVELLRQVEIAPLLAEEVTAGRETLARATAAANKQDVTGKRPAAGTR